MRRSGSSRVRTSTTPKIATMPGICAAASECGSLLACCGLHSLRRTFATLHSDAGVHPEVSRSGSDTRTRVSTFDQFCLFQPSIDLCFYPKRYGGCPDAIPLPTRIGDDPATLSLLHISDLERRQLTPAESAADQQREHNVVSFALQRAAVRHAEEFFGLIWRQPIAHPVPTSRDVRNVGKIACVLSPDQSVCDESGSTQPSAIRYK